MRRPSRGAPPRARAARASRARRRARAASSLVTTATTRYTTSTSQFSPSLRCSVCVGGRKSQLKASMLATATGSANASPQTTAIGSTANTYREPRLRTGAQRSRTAIAGGDECDGARAGEDTDDDVGGPPTRVIPPLPIWARLLHVSRHGRRLACVPLLLQVLLRQCLGKSYSGRGRSSTRDQYRHAAPLGPVRTNPRRARSANRRVVPAAEIERLGGDHGAEHLSARNRFRGVIPRSRSTAAGPGRDRRDRAVTCGGDRHP